MEEQLISLLKQLPFQAFFVLFVLLMFIKYPEKFELIAFYVSKVFSFTSDYCKKRASSSKLRADILSLTKMLNHETKDILPFDLKIEWVKEDTRSTFIENNQIIVRMRHDSNSQRNLIVGLTTFFEKGLLKKSKRYIDSQVSKSTDLALVRRVIVTKFEEALDLFDQEHLDPALQKDGFKSMFLKIQSLDHSGLLTQVVIREFTELANKLYPQLSEPYIAKETIDFINYLHRIATKEFDDIIELAFNGKNIKVGVVIIANRDNFLERGPQAYIDRIFRYIRKGIETIYITGSYEFKEEAENIIKEVCENFPVSDRYEFSYNHRTRERKIKRFVYRIVPTQNWFAQIS
ncbi:MAG TPA: hypothetical protein DC024_10505 [Clostridiales bacterium]|nr:hypothetical protein [Clostridiales bacterium]